MVGLSQGRHLLQLRLQVGLPVGPGKHGVSAWTKQKMEGSSFARVDGWTNPFEKSA